MQMYYRPSAKHPGLKLFFGETRRNLQRLPHRLTSRLTACGSRAGLAERREKVQPIGADVLAQVGESAPRGFTRFLEAANPDECIRQLGKALADHLPVAETGVNFEHLAETGNCGVPLFKTQFGHREASQQVRPFSKVF